MVGDEGLEPIDIHGVNGFCCIANLRENSVNADSTACRVSRIVQDRSLFLGKISSERCYVVEVW